MHISTIEKACREAGLAPVHRDKLKGYDLFIADGFVSRPEKHFARFGIEKGEFPLGCYVAMWALAKDEGKFHVGGPVFFEALHDGEWDKSTRQRGRINAAVRDAENHLKMAEKVGPNG